MTKQSKKSFLEHIERDRERWRGMKELDWQRADLEDPIMECDQYMDSFVKMDDYDSLCISTELDRFHEINNRISKPLKKMRTVRPADTILLIHLDVLDSIMFDKDGVFRIVNELADLAFFHRHLRDYNQVHINYYADEDDHLDLRYPRYPTNQTSSRYDFDRDDLARKSSTRSHFLLERAYRMRKCKQRFEQDPQRSADRLEKSVLRSFYKQCRPELTEAARAIDQAISRGFQVAVCGKMHISLLLALFALLNPRRVTADMLYSVLQKTVEYVHGKLHDLYPKKEIVHIQSVKELKSFL